MGGGVRIVLSACFSCAISEIYFLLLHLCVVFDENPRYKLKSQFEFVLESVSHCIGNIATDTVPSILGKHVFVNKRFAAKRARDERV